MSIFMNRRQFIKMSVSAIIASQLSDLHVLFETKTELSQSVLQNNYPAEQISVINEIKDRLNTCLIDKMGNFNDTITRAKVTHEMDEFLSSMINSRRIYDYYVICDEIINTPTKIDNNELHAEIYIKHRGSIFAISGSILSNGVVA